MLVAFGAETPIGDEELTALGAATAPVVNKHLLHVRYAEELVLGATALMIVTPRLIEIRERRALIRQRAAEKQATHDKRQEEERERDAA